MKMFWKYQLAVWLSIRNFYSHFTTVTSKCECFGRIVEPCDKMTFLEAITNTIHLKFDSFQLVHQFQRRQSKCKAYNQWTETDISVSDPEKPKIFNIRQQKTLEMMKFDLRVLKNSKYFSKAQFDQHEYRNNLICCLFNYRRSLLS